MYNDNVKKADALYIIFLKENRTFGKKHFGVILPLSPF